MEMKRKLFKTFGWSSIARHYIFKNVKVINFNFNGKRSFTSRINKEIVEKTILQTEPSEIEVHESYLKVGSKNCDLPYVIPEEDKEIVENLKKGDMIWPYKNPNERFVKIMKEDVEVTGKKILHSLTNYKAGDLEKKYFPRYADVVIVGGGVIGLSIAYAIKNSFAKSGNVIVVDKLLEPNQATTNLGTGTLLQQQFTEQEEIQMSKYGAEFFATFERQFGMPGHEDFTMPYEPLGSLFLANEKNADELLRKAELLDQYEIPYKLLEPSAIKSKFPWINTEGIVLGSLGMTNEGIYDPWTYLKALKCKLKNLGATIVKAEVIDFGYDGPDIKRIICRLPNGSYDSIDFCTCVLTGGIQSKRLIHLLNNAQLLKLKFPLEEKKRYEYCFFSKDGPGLNSPILVEPDGTYFRREGLSNLYVAGVPSVPCGENDDSEKDAYHIFETKIKPFLLERVPNVKDIVLRNGWVDYYDTNSANNVGIIGPHPMTERIYFALGFAQQGMQFAPAIGNAVMEHLILGEYKTIDLSCYHPENLYLKQHIEYEKKLLVKKLEELDRVSVNE